MAQSKEVATLPENYFSFYTQILTRLIFNCPCRYFERVQLQELYMHNEAVDVSIKT